MADRQAAQRPASRVAVVGCGRIGSLWDEDAPLPAAKPLTHAAAYQSHAQARLVALCDSEPARLVTAARKRGVPAAFKALDELLAAGAPDIVSLCTPAVGRLEAIRKIADAGCAVIFCEKPVAASLSEACEIRSFLAARATRFVVNYQRRWDSILRAVKTIIGSGELGEIKKAAGLYGNGLANNGSHLVDLANLLFGAPRSAQALGTTADDRLDQDATLDARITYLAGQRDFPLYLMGTDHRAYTVFELDIHFAEGRILISDRAQQVDIFRARRDSVFPGYRVLTRDDSRRSDAAMALSQAVDEVVGLHQQGLGHVTCGIDEAVSVLAVVEAARRSLRNGGREVLLEEPCR
ncbi:MAG: Gfo/Idh/MocA family protein [bacterium]